MRSRSKRHSFQMMFNPNKPRRQAEYSSDGMSEPFEKKQLAEMLALKSKAELEEWFCRYEWEDVIGHPIHMCVDFQVLLSLAWAQLETIRGTKAPAEKRKSRSKPRS